MYVSQSEEANSWLSILTNLQNRGVKDILIACVDRLTGFPNTKQRVFPLTDVHICIVHQIRNSMRYVWKQALKGIHEGLYAASTRERA